MTRAVSLDYGINLEQKILKSDESIRPGSPMAGINQQN
jgi:hypothetical protein